MPRAGPLPAAPTAVPFVALARWIPPRRDRRSKMRAAAGALARLTAGALSNPMGKASASLTSLPAVAFVGRRPPPLLSPSPGKRRQGGLPSPLEAHAAFASSSSAEARNAPQGRGESSSSPSSSSAATSFAFVAASERGTARLAALLSSRRRPGDVLLLYGDVGAGKSAFARAFVRSAAQDEELPVPSPTFLLHNVYDDSVINDRGPTIHHFDLYRLGGAGGGRVSAGSRGRGKTGNFGSEGEGEGPAVSAPASSLSALDADRCGLAEALSLVPPTAGGEENGVGDGDGGGGVSLVEWADRLGGSSRGSGGGPETSSTSSSSSASSSSSPSSSDAPFLLPGDRVLEVAIEPLPAERARELSARHPRLASSAEEEEEEEGEEEETEFDEFADTRWRLITLRPRGPRAREAAEEAARALRELNAGRETVSIEEEKQG